MNIERWLEKHEELIHHAQCHEQRYIQSVYEQRGDEKSQQLNALIARSHIAGTPVCNAIIKNNLFTHAPLPPGFTAVRPEKGSIRYPNGSIIAHGFGLNTQDSATVIDYCPAQSPNIRDLPAYPEEKIDQLLEQAPDLVHITPRYRVVVLYGTVREIYDRTHRLYSTDQCEL